MRGEPVVADRKDHRHQCEDHRTDRDDCQAVHIESRHGGLHPEMAGARAGSSIPATLVRVTCNRLARQDVVVNRLETELARLVEQQVLSAPQAQGLVEAARADRLDNQPVPDESAARSTPKSSAVLEVLGYVGGALVLGAVIMLGSFFWDDLGSTGRKLVAVASLVVPALGGAALVRGQTRPELGRILLALACYAAGFAYLVVFDDRKFVVSAAIVVLTSAVGAVVLRSGAFLVSGWSGAMLLVCAVVFNVIDPVGTIGPADTGSAGASCGRVSPGRADPGRQWVAAQPNPRLVTGGSQWLGGEHRAANGCAPWRMAVTGRRNSGHSRAAHRLCAEPAIRLRGHRLCDLVEHLAGIAVSDPRRRGGRCHWPGGRWRRTDRDRDRALSAAPRLASCIALIFSIANYYPGVSGQYSGRSSNDDWAGACVAPSRDATGSSVAPDAGLLTRSEPQPALGYGRAAQLR